MTDPTLSIENVQMIPTDDENVFVWAAWGTTDDGTGVMGTGDTKAAALADLSANAADAAPHDPASDVNPAETNPDAMPVADMPPDSAYVFDVPEFGTGLLASSIGPLGYDHDWLT